MGTTLCTPCGARAPAQVPGLPHSLAAKDFEERRVIIQTGVDAYCLWKVGTHDGPALVVLGGGAQQAEEFCVTTCCTEGRSVLVIEHPGHGKNKVASLEELETELIQNKHSPRAYAEHAQQVLACCQALLGHEFDVMGYSLGGGAAAHLLTMHTSGRIRRAVLVAPLLLTTVSNTMKELMSTNELKDVYGYSTIDGVDRFLDIAGMDPSSTSLSLKEDILANREDLYGLSYWPTYFGMRHWLGGPADAQKLLCEAQSKVIPPCLVFGFGADKVVDCRCCEKFAKTLQAEFVIKPNSGHAAHADKDPESFWPGLASGISSFLRSPDYDNPSLKKKFSELSLNSTSTLPVA